MSDKTSVSTANYPVPAQSRQIELEIKRSKFISFVGNAASRDEAEVFIRLLRQQHPQANHVCWAYIAGAPTTTVRSMSDDGEPSGTAGMPMLKVLQHSGLGDIVVAVVRYFGGTKLGTGGLQRAYSDAVTDVLKDLLLTLKVSRRSMHLNYDYAFDGEVSRILARYDVTGIESQYNQQIVTNLAAASADLTRLTSALINATSGKIIIRIDAD